MPLYTYRCENCGVQFDRHQSFEDGPITVCPECGEEALRKLFLPVGIVFRGSGFYATDHRSASGQTGTKEKDKAVTEKPKVESSVTESHSTSTDEGG